MSGRSAEDRQQCPSRRQNDLEAEIGAEAQTEIVMRAVVEVDFVTYIETKAQRAEVAFQACAGIKNAADVVSAEIVHAAEEGAQSSRRVAQTKVNAAGFKGYEGTNAAVAEVGTSASVAAVSMRSELEMVMTSPFIMSSQPISP